ncbi:hypothetical protein [Xanthobacter versatilis]|uniref:hypothetical protein n=1 Tax=Xanthobacter autotrophicus (strain ATCC BAA-1158 / Py2) TaxID=78245 RepID=UPI0037263B20
MVPAGSFADAKAFNFQFRACEECNLAKSAVEDHVSEITMLYSPGRAEDDAVDATARRKGKNSFDGRYPGQPVGEQSQELVIRLNAFMTITMVGGPQPDNGKIVDLSLYHMQGLFSLLCSRNPMTSEGTRLLTDSDFGFYGFVMRHDWGNAHQREIMRRVVEVPIVAQFSTAGGYYQCIIRRANEPGSPWFWALEWNKSMRVCGWIGDRENPPVWFIDLPSLGWVNLGKQGEAYTRHRTEVPLDEMDDILFPAIDEGQAEV